MDPNNWQIKSNLKKKNKMLIKKEFLVSVQCKNWAQHKYVKQTGKILFWPKSEVIPIINYGLSKECSTKSIIHKSILHQSYHTIHTLLH